MANQIETIGVINIKTDSAEKNVGNLKQRMREVSRAMQEMAANGDRASEEYRKLAEEAGRLAKAQREVAKDVSEASTTFSNTVQYTAGALAGVSGAVQTATSALSMMGVQMGDDSKLMKALVSAMAMTSGLQAIQNGVESFKLLYTNIKRSETAQKALNLAMKANPWALVASAVAATAVAFTLLNKNATDAERKINDAEREMENFNREGKNLKTTQEFAYQMAEAFGASKEELHELRREQLKLNYERAVAAKDEANRRKMQEKVNSKAYEKYAEQEKEYRAKEEEAWNEWIAFTNESVVSQAKAITAAKKEEEKLSEERAKQAKARLDKLEAEKATQEEINRALLEYRKLNGEIDELQYNEELLKLEEDKLKYIEQQDAANNTTSKTYITQQKVVDNLRASIMGLKKAQEEADAEKNKKNAQNDINDANSRDELYYQEEKNKALLDNQRDYNLAMIELDRELLERHRATLEDMYANNLLSFDEYQLKKAKYDEEEIKLEREKADRIKEINDSRIEAQKLITKEWYNNLTEMSAAVSGLLSGIADNLDEDTEAYKNIKAAQAIINTLSAAVASFAGITEATGGWGWAAAIAQAAAVTATGMATVRKIYAVNTSGGTNSASVSTTATGALSRNYTNTRLTDGTGAEIDLGGIAEKINDKKVYISLQELNEKNKNYTTTKIRNRF